MRKDVRIGMFVGIGLVFVGWVLFALYSETPQQRRQKQLAGTPAVSKSASKPASKPSASVPVTQPAPKPPVPAVLPPTEEPKPTEPKPAQQIHVVEPGQTLSAISTLYYGRADGWQKILEANSDLLQNPSQIRPGMRLKIPPK
jgi:nucleoid-associated protein YgaU